MQPAKRTKSKLIGEVTAHDHPRFEEKRMPRVALLIESSRTYGRGILQGIAQYARINGPWSFFMEERELHSGVPAWLRSWKGDGIIARIENQRMANELLKLNCPVVDVLAQERFHGISGFDTDARLVAEMAVNFFLKAGFRHFAYCGYEGIPFSDRRGLIYQGILETAGYQVNMLQALSFPGKPTDIQGSERQGLVREPVIAEWIAKQPRPLAVFACNDICAQQVLNACREFNLRVPEEIAVLGVDNDDVLCSLCDPPLSSIEPDTELIGYQAATLMNRLLHGEKCGGDIKSIPPKRLVERQSTDLIAIEDALVVKAVRYIREQVGHGIAVKDVLVHTGRSRTDLEQRFRDTFHHSMRTEILRRRMELVTRYLEETDLSVQKIAVLSGFSTSAHLCRLFQKTHGTTPLQHRLSRKRVGGDL